MGTSAPKEWPRIRNTATKYVEVRYGVVTKKKTYVSCIKAFL